jgi:hypothetical protein
MPALGLAAIGIQKISYKKQTKNLKTISKCLCSDKKRKNMFPFVAFSYFWPIMDQLLKNDQD